MIRDVLSSDALQIVNIYNYYIKNTTHTFEEDLMDECDYKKRIDDITRKYPFIVYEEDNKIIGYAYLAEFNYRSAYRYTLDLSIYLDPSYMGRGIGSILYKEIEKRAIAMGTKNIISLITSLNKESLVFHKKHGFDEVGYLDNVGLKFNKWLGVYFYQKKLNN